MKKVDLLIKRIFDLVFGILGLVLTSPLLLISIIFVFAEDRHNPFYTQERLTKGGATFRMYKVRTLVKDAEKERGPQLTHEQDPRITKAGAFLRRTKIDEIPQFINVIKGDMSLVGPRPERAYFYDLYCRDLPEFRDRLSVKGGMTGVSQVYGSYSMSPRDRLSMDLFYIENYSLLLDITLLLQTALAVFNITPKKRIF